MRSDEIKLEVKAVKEAYWLKLNALRDEALAIEQSESLEEWNEKNHLTGVYVAFRDNGALLRMDGHFTRAQLGEILMIVSPSYFIL